jgi:hypothetical protein
MVVYCWSDIREAAENFSFRKIYPSFKQELQTAGLNLNSPQKDFKNSTWLKAVRAMRVLLGYLSGGDTVELVYWMFRRELQVHFDENNKYKQVCLEVARITNDLSSHKDPEQGRKKQLRQAFVENLTIAQTEQLGLRISNKVRSRIRKRRFDSDWPVPQPKRGRHVLDTPLKTEIAKYWKSPTNTRPCPSRKLIDRATGNKVIVLELLYPKTALAFNFPGCQHIVGFKNDGTPAFRVCPSTVLNYMPFNVRKAQRKTGLCHYCWSHSTLIKKMNRYTNQIFSLQPWHPNAQNVFPDHDQVSDELAKFVQKTYPQIKDGDETGKAVFKMRADYKRCLKKVTILTDHMESVEAQNRITKKRNAPDGFPLSLALMTFDWKTSVVIGEGGEAELTETVFNLAALSYFGAGLEYRKEHKSLKDTLNFDVISNTLDHSSWAVTQQIKSVSNMKELTSVLSLRRIKDLEYQFDTASHLVSGEVFSYLMFDFPDSLANLETVTWNRLTEYHGKNSRDMHFSDVGNWVESSKVRRALSTAGALKIAVWVGRHLSNIRRKMLGLDPIITKVIINDLDYSQKPATYMHANIKNLRVMGKITRFIKQNVLIVNLHMDENPLKGVPLKYAPKVKKYTKKQMQPKRVQISAQEKKSKIKYERLELIQNHRNLIRANQKIWKKSDFHKIQYPNFQNDDSDIGSDSESEGDLIQLRRAK